MARYSDYWQDFRFSQLEKKKILAWDVPFAATARWAHYLRTEKRFEGLCVLAVSAAQLYAKGEVLPSDLEELKRKETIMANEIYDVIIIGGGPGGLTAAIYSGRDNNKTLLLEKEICGGLVAKTHLVENFPGFPEGANGTELIEDFKKQALRFGTEIKEFVEVKSLEKDGDNFVLKTNSDDFVGKNIIIASGSQPRMLGVPGEKELMGRGVSYCATCDGPLYRGADVAVIGMGNSGAQESIYLMNLVDSIACVEFLPQMQAEKILQKKLEDSDKVDIYVNHQLMSINGEETVESITIKNRETDDTKDIPVTGVFVYIGFKPEIDFLDGMLETDDYGYIITDEKMQTSEPGIFAVGDIRSKLVRQISVACGEGTIAAISVRERLQE